MHRVESKTLGCEIGLVEDEEERRQARESGIRLVLYSRDEVERMRGLAPDGIRAIHELKQDFGGVYVGPSDTDWPERAAPPTVSLFDLAENPASFPGGWGDEVDTPNGVGVVVNVWDNDHDASHVTVQLDGGAKVVFPAMEVRLCASAV